MWLKGSVRIYVRSMFGELGRRLSSAATMTRYWSPSSAWHGDGWWACCLGGAGRDLRHVGVRGGESVWGPCRGMCTHVEGRKLESGELAQCLSMAGPRGCGMPMEGVS
jgi:hypothetical protein